MFTEEAMQVATRVVAESCTAAGCRHDVGTNLYIGDVRELLAMQREQPTADEAADSADPRHALIGLESDDDCQRSASEPARTPQRERGSCGGGGGGRYSKVDVEMARRAHVGNGNTDLHKMEHMARHGCWANMPPDPQGIFATIARKQPCVWCRLARGKHINRSLGTGVRYGETGAVWSYDLLGP
jgi:hypothetical protein